MNNETIYTTFVRIILRNLFREVDDFCGYDDDLRARWYRDQLEEAACLAGGSSHQLYESEMYAQWVGAELECPKSYQRWVCNNYEKIQEELVAIARGYFTAEVRDALRDFRKRKKEDWRPSWNFDE